MNAAAPPRTSGATTRAPVPAATVVVVRDGDAGLQVLMQERALASDFVGGAWVFPGGKVDPRDALVDPDLLGPHDLATLHARLGAATEDQTRALLVAAVRETFEEAGVLLATVADDDGADPGRRQVTSGDLAEPAWREARAGLAGRGLDHDWRPFLADQQLVLSLGALRPLAWWITPHGLHRRFSTRFLVAPCPPGQDTARHDDVEMTGTVWIAPGAALDAAERGERMVIFPTRRVLAELAGMQDVAAVLARADRGGFDLRPIVPLNRSVDGELRVQHPDGGPPVAV